MPDYPLADRFPLRWSSPLSAPPSADLAAADLSYERYGLQLVDESPGAAPNVKESGDARPLRPFDWSLLAGFAAIQIAHLTGLALLARWVVLRLLGD